MVVEEAAKLPEAVEALVDRAGRHRVVRDGLDLDRPGESVDRFGRIGAVGMDVLDQGAVLEEGEGGGWKGGGG